MPELTNYIARANASRAKEIAGTESPFSIEVRFRGGLTETQQAAFTAAADRWVSVIIGDLPDVTLSIDGEAVTIDDLLIYAEGATINGDGHILGQAAPLWWRPDSFLPAFGFMRFDTADLERMERNGTLNDVITHEMGHVLGFGKKIWGLQGLINGVGTDDPTFSGRAAMVEYAHLSGAEHLTPVPLENLGQPGSRDSHWRESVFRVELMTSTVGGPGNPMSRLTIACLADMAYPIDFEASEKYELPAVPVLDAALCTGPDLAGLTDLPEAMSING